MRPFPPQWLVDTPRAEFLPAPEIDVWVRENFIDEGAPLENPEHAHLRAAHIGWLWTNVANQRRGRRILGSCQLMPPNGECWGAGRATYQIEKWFGSMPDFLITLDAAACMDMDDTSFMALVEHEALHAGQAKDKFGSPMFSKQTGRPVFCTRAHDFEEFIGVVERYGATSHELAAAVRFANKGPSIGSRKIEIACGTCLRLVK